MNHKKKITTRAENEIARREAGSGIRTATVLRKCGVQQHTACAAPAAAFAGISQMGEALILRSLAFRVKK